MSKKTTYPSSALIQRACDGFNKDLRRAYDLYSKLVVNGRTDKNGNASPLSNPDRRDLCENIFFECAAKFEGFVIDAFCIEVRNRFRITTKYAYYVMGSVDWGAHRLGAWALPRPLIKRAQNLYGKNGFFGRLDEKLTDSAYHRLADAYRLRNRIAHSGTGTNDYKKTLDSLQIPIPERPGINPGRVLLEYPRNNDDSDNWFFRFLSSYQCLLDNFRNDYGV